MSDNVYYNPEKFGLTVFDSIEWSEAYYSYDTTVVFQDENKVLYWASDSGCSCPTPFDGYKTLTDLSTGPKEQLIEELQTRIADWYDRDRSCSGKCCGISS